MFAADQKGDLCRSFVSLLRSGKHPKTRTNCRKKDTPFGKSPQFPNRSPQKRYSVREITPKPERTAAKEILRSGKHPKTRTNCHKRDTSFGKPPQNPNELPQKRYSVRGNTPIPERTAAKKILRSGNHPKTRSVCRKRDTPFGKTTRNPNELPQKRYSVRETTPIPEPFAAKEILRSGEYPNSRTNCRKIDTPFGKTPQNPNELPQKRYSVRENISNPERSIVFNHLFQRIKIFFTALLS